jgi:hypothetical protein
MRVIHVGGCFAQTIDGRMYSAINGADLYYTEHDAAISSWRLMNIGLQCNEVDVDFRTNT